MSDPAEGAVPSIEEQCWDEAVEFDGRNQPLADLLREAGTEIATLRLAVKHLRLLVAENPWSGSYDDDWCHFCGASPSYGPKPWTGHNAECLWLAADSWLRALDTSASGATQKDPRLEA